MCCKSVYTVCKIVGAEGVQGGNRMEDNGFFAGTEYLQPV